MLSGPEMARLLKHFEEECIHGDNTEMSSNLHHHEQGLSTQKTFQQQVVNLAETIKPMGNPFLDIFTDLVTPGSGNCTAESVVTTNHSAQSGGNWKKAAVILSKTCFRCIQTPFMIPSRRVP